MRRSHKIHNTDLFTSAANASFQMHLKTQGKRALELINAKVDWAKLLRPLVPFPFDSISPNTFKSLPHFHPPAVRDALERYTQLHSASLRHTMQ